MKIKLDWKKKKHETKNKYNVWKRNRAIGLIPRPRSRREEKGLGRDKKEILARFCLPFYLPFRLSVFLPLCISVPFSCCSLISFTSFFSSFCWFIWICKRQCYSCLISFLRKCRFKDERQNMQ